MRIRNKILIAAGMLLLCGGLGLLLGSQLLAQKALEKTAGVLKQMEAVLPERSPGVMDSYSVPEMPVLQVKGEDFIAVLELPALGITLPVGSSWDTRKVREFPCRFTGSVYDGTLIIGGSDQKGQFENFEQLEDGSAVILTDMTSAEFSYTIERIERAKSARADILTDDSCDLTLFVRDAYSMEYLLVRCKKK